MLTSGMLLSKLCGKICCTGFAEPAQCLSLMLHGDTKIVPRIKGEIKDIRSNLSRVSFYVEPKNENLAKKYI